MASGIFITLVIIAIPIAVFLWGHKEDLKREEVKEKVVRYGSMILGYTLVVTLLNQVGLIEHNAFQIVVKYWAVLPIYYGLKMLWQGHEFFNAIFPLMLGYLGSIYIVVEIAEVLSIEGLIAFLGYLGFIIFSISFSLILRYTLKSNG